MKKINLTRKLLFFLGLAPLNEERDLDFNFKTRTIIILIFISSIFLFNKYFLNIFISNLNIFLRVIITLTYLFIWVNILYLITIKQYKKSKE